MNRIIAEWVAEWTCPECSRHTTNCEKGVEDQNDYFDVECQECGEKYEVYKS